MSDVMLTRVFRKDVETKYGIKPKLSIQTDKHGESWLSTFKVAGTENWQEGDTVSINVQEKGEFLNFEPTGGSGSGARAPSSLEPRVEALERAVFGTNNAPTAGGVSEASTQVQSEEPVIQADDLPFGDEDEGDGF